MSNRRPGEHDSGDLRRHALGNGLRVQDAVFARWDRNDLVLVQGCTGGIGPVGRVGDHHVSAALAGPLVVGADHHDAGQFALRAGRGLE